MNKEIFMKELKKLNIELKETTLAMLNEYYSILKEENQKYNLTRITEEDDVKIAALHSGFVQVLQDEITVLAEIAEWPDEIDKNRAEEARIRAERRLEMSDPNINIKRAEIALKKSLVRIEVVNK